MRFDVKIATRRFQAIVIAGKIRTVIPCAVPAQNLISIAIHADGRITLMTMVRMVTVMGVRLRVVLTTSMITDTSLIHGSTQTMARNMGRCLASQLLA